MSQLESSDAAFHLDEEALFSRDIDGQLLRLDEVTFADLSKDVEVYIDGKPVTVKKAVPKTDSQGKIMRDSEGRPIPRATTIYDAANERFIKHPWDVNPIPVLCHQEHLAPVGVCRVCVVEIAKMKDGKVKRERKLLPACQHRVEETMQIQTIASPDLEARARIESSVRVLTELLMADHLRGNPEDQAAHSELAALARRLNLTQSRFAAGRPRRPQDRSSEFIKVDHDACILCDRCVRACDDVKKYNVIGRSGKGYDTHVAFDLDVSMADSQLAESCQKCGECMISCPTDALTFVKAVERSPQERLGDVVTADELRSLHPLFRGVPRKFLQWNSGAVRYRIIQAGESICVAGDPGNTAFVILSGSFEVSVPNERAKVKTERSAGLLQAFLGKLTTSLVSRPATAHGPIRNDGGAPLSQHRRNIRTPRDVILGEMTCLSHYPRSATVQALEKSEVVEIDRSILQSLQRNKASREILDWVYRRRALNVHLSKTELLAGLDAEQKKQCIKFLRKRVELVRVDKGQVIFHQGEKADHFYTVRLGFVKISQTIGGQDRVLDYHGPGKSFGEIGLLTSLNYMPESAHAGAPKGVRMATCSALDDVELVRIKGDDFRALLELYPAARQKIVELAEQRVQQTVARSEALTRPLGEFLDKGLFNAQKLLVLDLEACTRCDECTRACADTHEGVTRLIREGLRFDKFLVASSCRSCLDPYCLVGCPVDAIHRRPRHNDPTALEIVIEDHCIGCGECAKNCPYGNINIHELADKKSPTGKSKKATTCDLCRQVVSSKKDPSCVYACPHHAAFRISGEELKKRVELSDTARRR